MSEEAPRPTRYHRFMGWHAPALRRTMIVLLVWVVVGVGTGFVPGVDVALAVIIGWDVAAIVYLGGVWPIVLRADGAKTAKLASREDQTHGTATGLLAGASAAALLGVGFALGEAGRSHGPTRGLLIGVAVLTVALAWVTMNTVYLLRYAHLDYLHGGGARIDFGQPLSEHKPTYRDFAYLAFTIGMTYQVSDTTIRSSRVRKTALAHGLISYVFGVAIIAGAINLIAGLVN